MGKNIYILILLLTIGGLLAWYFFFRKDPVPEQVDIYHYQTDTVYVDVPYEVPVPYSVPTPPRTVTIYKVDSAAIKDLKLILAEQELRIEGLLDTISLHQNYLKQYPYNPKLIGLALSRDTISMGLLQISGQIEERSWPIDLNRWAYNWNYDASLTRHPTKPPPIKDEDFLQFFLGGGGELLAMSPYVSGRFEMNIKKFRLYTDTHFLFTQPDQSIFRIGLEYRVWQKQR